MSRNTAEGTLSFEEVERVSSVLQIFNLPRGSPSLSQGGEEGKKKNAKSRNLFLKISSAFYSFIVRIAVA